VAPQMGVTNRGSARRSRKRGLIRGFPKRCPSRWSPNEISPSVPDEGP
jgi:hypothetical protein